MRGYWERHDTLLPAAARYPPPVAGAVEELGGGQQLAPHACGQQGVLVPAQVAGGHHGAGRDGPHSHEHAAAAAAATCAAIVVRVRCRVG